MAKKVEGELVTYHFKVEYQKSVTRERGVLDYRAANLQEVLRILRTEDISMATTDLLVIHQIKSDGRVLELLSHDDTRPENKGKVTLDFRNATVGGRPVEAVRVTHSVISSDDENFVLSQIQRVLKDTKEEYERNPQLPLPVVQSTHGKKGGKKNKPRIKLKSNGKKFRTEGFWVAQEAEATHVDGD